MNKLDKTLDKLSAKDIAKYIIHSFQEVGDQLSNMKLQKLLYYVQGWHLANFDVPAFEEHLEAWTLGPVQPDVYNDYKKFDFRPITEGIPRQDLKDENLCALIDEILDTYGNETGFALYHMTCQEAPWLTTRGNLSDTEPSHRKIKNSLMLNFFKSQRRTMIGKTLD